MTIGPTPGGAPPRPTLAERAVDRIARSSDRRSRRRGITRRSFLVRAAVVGSALSVAPMRWMLRPTTAYASVCGTGATCSGGWTAFCCTINDGANTCPPGSYVAGWWKIDRSPFCGDAPRYIVDCNRSPGASCTCRCASGSCDERRVCCNNFRYGQCNTHIPGVTEVVCRVVLCTTPWTWDPSCGRTVRTDNRTVTHNAPCLPGTDPTPIELHYQDLGMTGSALGRPVGEEEAGPRSGAWRRYEHGLITHQATAGTHVLLGEMASAYTSAGGPGGPLGYPTADSAALEAGLGEWVAFERGALYVRDGGEARILLGPTAVRYAALDGPAGPLGHPVTDTIPTGDGRGSVTGFERGAIYASGRTGAQELLAPHAERLEELGGPVASGLGYPLRPTTAGLQPFEHGLMVNIAGRLHVLRGAIARRYAELGGPAGPWGAPLGDQIAVGTAQRADFDAASVFSGTRADPDTGVGAHAVREPVLAAYLAAGGPEGELGLPTGDSFVARNGHRRGDFRSGAIEVDPAGRVRRIEPRTTRSAQDLTS